VPATDSVLALIDCAKVIANEQWRACKQKHLFVPRGGSCDMSLTDCAALTTQPTPGMFTTHRHLFAFQLHEFRPHARHIAQRGIICMTFFGLRPCTRRSSALGFAQALTRPRPPVLAPCGSRRARPYEPEELFVSNYSRHGARCMLSRF